MNNKAVIVSILATFLLLSAVLVVFMSNTNESSQAVQAMAPITSTSNLSDARLEHENSSDIFLILTIVLSLTALVATSISFYLYKWRKILLSDSKMILPEDWAKYMQLVSVKIHELGRAVEGGMSTVGTEVMESSKRISNMTSTYMELQSALDEKDHEIRRLRNGYDQQIFKRFISRFIRVEQALTDVIRENGETESLLLIRRLLEDAFEECGVTKFEPEVGEDYRNAYGVADNPKTDKTDDKNKDFVIAEVIEPGYRFDGDAGEKVIVPSKVKIYKYA